VLPSVLHSVDVFFSVAHLELSDHGGTQSLAQACSHAFTHVRRCTQLVATESRASMLTRPHARMQQYAAVVGHYYDSMF
jgi:hypothetical protein